MKEQLDTLRNFAMKIPTQYGLEILKWIHVVETSLQKEEENPPTVKENP